jgi:biopolymer transport protein ExbB
MIEPVKIALVDAGASWVLWLLAGLSILSVTVMLERLFVFRAQRDNMAALASELHKLLAKQDIEATRTRLAKSPSTAAAVALAGLARWQSGTDAAKEAMLAATGLQRARLERRLLFLGTVGNNAPFIGLLGTVIGVVPEPAKPEPTSPH